MVDGIWKNIFEGLSPLRRPKLSKKVQDKGDEIQKKMKIISGGMIGNSNYIGTSFNGLIQELKLKGKNLIQFIQLFFA